MNKIQLSAYHKIFYNEWKLNQTLNKYNIYIDQVVSKELNLDQLSLAFSRFISDHLILNSHVVEINGIPHWVANDKINHLEIFDDISSPEEILEYISRSFMLDSEPLYRFAVFNTSDNHYRLVLVFHNIILQESNVAAVVKTLSNYYNDINYQIPTTIKQQKKLLAEVIRVSYSQISGDIHKEFWHTVLSDIELLDFKFIHSSSLSTKKDYKTTQFLLEFPQSTRGKLTKLEQQFNIDAYGYSSIILSILLNRYTAQARFGMSNIVEIIQKENNLFCGGEVNNVIYPYSFEANTTGLDLITRYVQFTSQIQDNKHMYYPITDIIESSDTRLPEIFCSRDNSSKAGFSFDYVKLIQINNYYLDVPAKLLFTLNTHSDKLSCVFTCNESAIEKNILEQFIKHYKKLYLNILSDLCQHKIIPISEYQLLNVREYNEIVYTWNKTEQEYPSDKTLHELFEEQVVRTPNDIALVYEDKKLSYKELNEKANQLAHYLKNTYEIKGDDLIALCLDRNEYMLIGILATLKAGGAYVPIDPSYPEERIDYILEDTKAKALLINEVYQDKLFAVIPDVVENSYSILLIDSFNLLVKLKEQPITDLQANIKSTNLAYIIYTSGTTGKPKGVMIEHRGVVNTVLSINNLYNIKPSTKVTFFTSYVFDVSVSEIFTPLSKGYELHMLPEEIRRDAHLISAYLSLNKINVCYLPPVLLSSIKRHAYPDLDHLIYAGEPCDYETGKYWSEHKKLFNYYGPTETSIYCLGKQVVNGDVNLVGRPLNNMTAYILDNNLKILPVGAVGELYIGGAGIARGYLNLPALSDEKFISNPFQSDEDRQQGKNARLYRTGDLARYVPDGNIEYIGRNDFQVKIRGFRIELGEIEAKLSSYPEVKQAVVLAKERNINSDKYLVGYYVADAKLDEAAMLSMLTASLPEYMVPSALVHMESLPLTRNGKLDRKSLPDTEFSNAENYVAPRNEIERQVCQVYAEELGVDASQISIHDNFFRLGGNSILAIKLVNRLTQEIFIGRKINVNKIFEFKTISSLVDNLFTNNDSYKMIIPKLDPTIFATASLSFAQERLWFIENYIGGSNAYNIPFLYRLATNTDVNLLCKALQDVVLRHEVLHSLIKMDINGVGYQEVIDPADMPLLINHVKLARIDDYQPEINQEVNYIFKLEEEYPFRISILNCSDTAELYLLFVVHHIAFDGWSLDIFLRDIYEYYTYHVKVATGQSATLHLPDLSIQYKDFAVWQRTYLQGDKLEHQLTYWEEKLTGYERLNLITDYPRPDNFNYAGDDILFKLDRALTHDLRVLAKKLGVSFYNIMLSGFNLLLKCYSNQDDIVVGSPIANRIYPQLENMIGFFVNNIVQRSKIDPGQIMDSYINQTSYETIKAQSYQDLPFEKLVERLDRVKDPRYHPIFQIMFGVQSFGSGMANQLLTETTDIQLEHKVAKFDLTVMVGNVGEELSCSFNYATSLYKQSTIERLINTYKHILEEIVSKHNRPIKELTYLPELDYKKIVYTWNETEQKYPNNKTIHGLFEEQAARTPNNIAVVYKDKQLTYSELNQKANQLGHYLKDICAIKGDDLIALFLDRNEYMLVAILGVLKSGGAYVPLDPQYPQERVNYILEDTQAKVVIINECHYERLPSHCKHRVATYGEDYYLDASSTLSPSVLSIDSPELNRILYKQSTSNLLSDIKSHNLAYVIYTSGTTGKPKGVMIEHSGIVNRIVWMNDTYPINESDNILQKTPYVFDVSVWELFWGLWYGARIVFLKPDGHKDANYIVDIIHQEKISVIHFVPSMLSVFNQTLSLSNKSNMLSSLKYIFCSGEALPLSSVKDFSRLLPSVPIHNLYGPTEASVDVLYYDCSSSEAVYIGKPIYNTTAYVLDNSLNPLPVGAIGELYIGGAGLARGYLNLPELTKERFIANPFQTKVEKAKNKNARLYKTGDLVRYLPDGNIEYIGRNDHQVKIRGFRIELGEIETRLSSYSGVKQAVVLALSPSTNLQVDNQDVKYLVAYYVADKKLDEDGILKQLSQDLPEYMVPSVLVYLDKLPLTINGKLDRRALPNPEFKSEGDTYVAPRNDLEEQVCAIYSQVLGMDATKVGMKDDFFRLGGNSILAIKLVNQLNNKVLHDTKINVSAIFKHKTIDRLLDSILSEDNAEVIIIPKLDSAYNEVVPLSFAQERLWFIESYEGGSNAYNIPMLYNLHQTVDLDKLIKAIESTVSRHEVLHSVIKTDDDGTGYMQACALGSNSLVINQIEIRSKKEYTEAISEETNYIFKLDNEYPIRFNLLLCYDTDERYLLITIHHIAFDGWSKHVFLRDLETYYHYYAQLDLDQKNSTDLARLNLPKLSIQYRDFAVWQRGYLSGGRLEHQLNYWRNKLSGYEGLNLITDYARPKKISYSGNDVLFRIDIKTTAKLQQLAKDLGVSLYCVLLSGFNLLLRVYSNQDDIVIGTPIANRHHTQLEDLVGFFVNTLALRSIINPELTLRDYIQQTGHEIIEAQLHQDLPFEKLVDELNVEKDESRHPLFQVVFGLQSFEYKTNTNSLLIETDYRELDYKIAKFDITLMIDDSKDVLEGIFNYSTSLYTKSTISDFIVTYTQILKQLAAQADQHIKNLSYLTPSKYQQIVYNWNKTEQEYPNDKTIPELFEEQVANHPNNIAIVYADNHLTYNELNQKANRLANYLKDSYQIKGDDLIALCLDRSEDMLVAILAVLKAGGAYVPLDPKYPKERINYILQDTQAKVFMCNSAIFQNSWSSTLVIDTPEFKAVLDKQSTLNPKPEINSQNLAYVVYTSGTTGKPKGVMIEHSGVVSLVSNNRYINITAEDGFIQLADIAFDAATFEIWGALLNGARLYFADNKLALVTDINQLGKFIDDNSISILWLTKTLFDHIYLQDRTLFKSLNYLLVGGEALDKNLVLDLTNSEYSPKHFINGYGPTENTTFSCTYEVKSTSLISNLNGIPIGKPISNTQAYVLNSDQNLVPVGAVGELYLSGIGVARGYLNQPQLTAEKFIANPFQTEVEKVQNQNSRLYKTGDLVRYLPDGNIEYIGRNDFQVKIRGFRIELGEIEARISSYPEVKQAVVLAQDHSGTTQDNVGHKYLVAYYVADKKLNEKKILKQLSHDLPEYMVPNVLVYLDKLPLTINGKLDRKALPAPDFTDNATYVAPRSELEFKVCSIYAEILGLSVDKISITDNFFYLGGNSILALKLTSRINKELNLEHKFNLASIFKYKTIQRMVDSLENHIDNVKIPVAVVVKPEEQLLSFAQERLWFLEQYESGNNAYNLPLVAKLDEAIDLDILKRSIKSVVNRHQILRSVIKTSSDGTGYQVVLDDNEHPLEIRMVEVVNNQQLQEYVNIEVNHIYSIDSEHPIRVCIYRENLAKNFDNTESTSSKVNYYISIVVHHIAFDWWSINVLLKDIVAYYNYYMDMASGRSNIQLDIPLLSIQYKDFALWQRSYLTGDTLERQLKYWKDKLEGYTTLNLPLSKPRSKIIDYVGENYYFEVDDAVTLKLRNVAKNLNVSLSSLLLSAYYILLGSYANQDDIVIGMPIANRHYQQLENLVGFFVNTLALRVVINKDDLIANFVEFIGNEVSNAQLHQDLPFEKLVNELNVVQDTSRHPIFQVMFNMITSESLQIDKVLKLENLMTDYTHAKFDLTLYIEDSNPKLKGNFNYATRLFERENIKYIARTYDCIIEQLSNLKSNSRMKVRDLNFLNSEDYLNVVYDWNQITPTSSANQTLPQLFEEQVGLTPNSIALVSGDRKLTYTDLNNRSNQLAHHLIQSYNVSGDDIIALCLDRTEHMIIGMLGVLKSGGAYLPLMPSYPDSRIAQILTDAQVKLVLFSEKYEVKLTSLVKNSINGSTLTGSISNLCVIDSIESLQIISQQSTLNPKPNITSQNLAYVIFTSGTTGRPKGVMIEHHSVVDRLVYLKNQHNFPSDFTFGAKIPYVFDPSLRDIFMPLILGGKVVMFADDVYKDTDKILEMCVVHQINFLIFVPSHLELFIESLERLDKKELSKLDLRIIYSCGERLTIEQSKALFKYIPDIKLINQYGPSECCQFQFEIELSRLNINNFSTIPVGHAVKNVTFYVLNNSLQPIPCGAVGELYIGGTGVARGYLNQEQLTAERFIPNPFQTEIQKAQNKNGRLYKTGDLVRYLPDGSIEYIGRNDFQVKIHGFRVELGEIEAKLSCYPGVKQVVVLALEYGDGTEDNSGMKYLAGYYVADSKLDEEAMLKQLSNELPEYMVPSVLVYLKNLPLMVNGKLDRKSLPNPEFKSTDSYVAPRNELEQQICEIYGEVLGIAAVKVGITDNFFRLGGNSILAIKLTNMINYRMGTNLTLKLIFEINTVTMIAKKILDDKGNFLYENYKIEHGDVLNQYKPFPLNNIQQAYFLGRFDIFELGNISTHSYREWKYAYLDVERLELAFNKILQRHLGLRIVVTESGEQKIFENFVNYTIEFRELNSEKELIKVRHDQSTRTFDVEKFPLFDISVSKYKDNYYLHLNFDTILLDGYSFGLLFTELTMLYLKPEQNLPPLNITCRDYTLQYMKIRESNLFEDAKKYWVNKIDDYDCNVSLPIRNNPNTISKPKFCRISRTINNEIWNKVKQKAIDSKVSTTAVVLTVYGMVLRFWSNQQHFMINLTLADRLPLHPDIDNVIGDFTRLELFNFTVQGNQHISDLIFTNNQILWSDIEHILFDGIDLQRLLRQEHSIPGNRVIAPIVLTSVLGASLSNKKMFIDESFLEVSFSASQTSQVWLDNKAYETSDGFVAEWDYVEQLFEQTTIETMHEQYCYLIEYLSTANWEVDSFPALQLSLRNMEIINQINTPFRHYLEDTLFGNYEKYITLNKLQDNIAVIDSSTSQKICYQELIKQSNLLARYIAKETMVGNVHSGKLIGILSEKGFNQVVGSLAIMKSGYGYLPLNVSWPIARLDEILEEGKCEWLLVSKHEYERIYELREKYKLLIIEDILNQLIDDNKPGSSLLNPGSLPQVTPHDIAYVIFTSGSTGKPKGVTISHKGALNTIFAVNEKYHVTSQEKILALSELSFDLSVYDIFGMLVVGGCIVFPRQDMTKNPKHWIELIHKHQVTMWNTVPQLAGLLIDEIKNSDLSINSLKLFLLSGDWIPLQLPGMIQKACSNAKVVSLGGATEGSIWSIWYEIYSINDKWKSIPYGIAMPNQQIYVLKPSLEHCPLLVPGEIFIGGAGVALGYWEDEVKTTNSFIEHPNLGRLYKTGDIGRYSPEGYIEFLGRKDSQLKIRGYRVDLSEIEAKLSGYPEIKQGVVLALEHSRGIEDNSSTKYLVGYYVADTKLDEDAILNHLSNELPEYMVPSALVYLDKLPLTINGKLDHKALPVIELIDTDKYIAPRNEFELQACAIYAEVLGLETDKVGITDDFFRLGGNSILAIKLVSKLGNYFKTHLQVSDIFRLKCVENLVTKIIQNKDEYQPLIQLNNATEDKPFMFMIHPGGGGCEVYFNLASKLTQDFKCFGVDYYNLYTANPISNVRELAAYYLKFIKMTMMHNKQKTYHLLGWSLGGMLALEIAGQLEKMGIFNIKVYLLDSYIYEKSDKRVADFFNCAENRAINIQNLQAQNLDKSYIHRLAENFDTEIKLVLGEALYKLKYTTVLLLKATLSQNSNLKFRDGFFEYCYNLPYNNIDQVVNVENIKLIKLKAIHHGNILTDGEEVVVSSIKGFNICKK